jgi:hypothetical protein
MDRLRGAVRARVIFAFAIRDRGALEKVLTQQGFFGSSRCPPANLLYCITSQPPRTADARVALELSCPQLLKAPPI